MNPIQRVAMRYLSAHETNHLDNALGFKESMVKFEMEFGYEIEKAEANEPLPPNRYTLKSMQARWTYIRFYGVPLASWAIETRSIPAGKAKKLELALRELNKARPPSDPIGWWLKNLANMQMLLEAETWPERGGSGTGPNEAGIQELVRVGPFQIHNTLHLPDSKLQSTLDVIEKSAQLIRAASSKFAKVLYGDVYLVGKLDKSKTLAWYNINDDKVYVRPHLKKGRGELHNLTHELGHRYWFKFMTSPEQAGWTSLYRETKRGGEAKDMPKIEIGKPLPVPIDNSHDVGPIVTGFKGGIIQLEGGKAVNHMGVLEILRGNVTRAEFPTAYAATSDKEFFAECFALYVLGTLDAKFKEPFERILGL